MSIIEPSDTTIGPAPVAAPPEPAPESVAEVPETPEEPEVFDREYVEGLRGESTKYRTRARDYEQTFEGYDDETAQGWMQLIQMAKDADGSPEVQQYLAEMLGLAVPDATPTPEQFGDIPDFLTREEATQIARQEAQALYQQGETIQAQQRAVESIQTQAQSLGYDAESPDYILLLKFATDMDEPDLNAAHQQVQEYQQAQYDAFIARKEEEARTSPASPTGNGVAPSIVAAPKTWEQARDSLHERLSNI